MKLLLLVGALAIGLSGCDAALELNGKVNKLVRDDIGPMAYAFVPGYKVTVGDKTFPIYGHETCPKAVAAKVFIFGGGFDYQAEGLPACVVIRPDTAHVSVQQILDNGQVSDRVWRVERDDDNGTLRLWNHEGKAVSAVAPAGEQTSSLWSAEAHNCVTNGENSPIVTGANSIVVINGQTFVAGQAADCAQPTARVSTHGANSPIITGDGSRVFINTDR